MATPRRPVQFTMGARSGSNAAHAQIRTVEDGLLAIIQGMKGAPAAFIIKRALEPTFKKARDVYCPKDTGALRASGFLEIVDYRGNPRVDIGFGRGGNPHYAPIVHEDMDMHHKSPTRSKFLQAAMLEDTKKIEVRLAEGYRANMIRNSKRRKGAGRG